MEIWQAVSAVSVGLGAGLIGVALARLPRTPIAPPLYAFVASGVLWAVGAVIADASTGMASKQAGLALLYTGSIVLPACWWAIVLRWADQEHAGLPFRSAAWLRVPFAFAAMMWLLMITNPWHGAFLTPIVGGRNAYEPLWYAMAVPNYTLILAALAAEVAVVRRISRTEVQRQGAFLISASLVTLLGNALYVSGLVNVDATPMVLSASGALLVIGMAREGLFGVLPAALRDIAADHPDGLVVVGPKGHVQYANARAHALLAPVEIPSSSPFVDVLQDERLRPESFDLIERSAGDPWTMLGRDGGVLFRLVADRSRWLRLSATEVRGRLGRVSGYRLRVSDLTAQRKAELHARQARRLDSVADLARTITRQFQGIFALVQSNADLLLTDSNGDATSERKLSQIIDAAKSGSELAQQLQLYTGSMSTTRVVLELSEVVHESCELLETDVPGHVRLSFDRSRELLPVYVDALQLRHCVFNVLMNAIEAMAHTDGEIHLSTGARWLDPANIELVWGDDQASGEYAYVRVRDEGGGMDPETEERAFEPFFSTQQKDRGVGLPTVLGIARAHGALIALQNEHGRGCEFTLYFPIDRGAAPNSAPAPPWSERQ